MILGRVSVGVCLPLTCARARLPATLVGILSQRVISSQCLSDLNVVLFTKFAISVGLFLSILP